MKWAFLFFGILLLGLVYEISESWFVQWGKVDLFLRHDHKMYPSSYVYYSNQNIESILWALAFYKLMCLFSSLKPFAYFATAFAIVEGIDLIDFWITRNSLWFEFRGYPITYNVIKVFIFTVLLGHELIRRHTTA